MQRPEGAIPSRKKGSRNAQAESVQRKESKLKRKWLEKKEADALKVIFPSLAISLFILPMTNKAN